MRNKLCEIFSCFNPQKQKVMGLIPELSVLRGETHSLPCDKDNLLHRIFELAAQKYAQNPALFEENDSINPIYTFQQLDNAASQLARILLQKVKSLNLKPNNDGDFIVGVSLSPGAPLIITLLAIWKIGAAYMPLEPSIPPERASHIIKDSNPLFVVAESNVLQDRATILLFADLQAEACEVNTMPLNDENTLMPNNNQNEILAAVLYTSGSTGSPKGVRIPHRAALNRLRWQWREFPFLNDEHTCVFKTALSFVDSVGEMFAPLLQGKALAMIPRSTVADPERLAQALARHGVKRLVLVPSLLRALLLLAQQKSARAQGLLSHIQLWICSGEELQLDLVKEFFEVLPGAHIANFYGSTEVMGDVTYFVFRNMRDVEMIAQNDARAPIGYTLDNTVIYLLDKDFRPVTVGERGELYVAGRNVANNYVGGRDPSRFLPNPLATDPVFGTIYRTGDYARVVKGLLVYEGRADSQIKVRGNRVDLAEVERAVRSVEGLDKVIVLCWRPGRAEQAILAFVTMAGDPIPIPQIETILQRSLASYMMPQLIVLDTVPLLVNGKTDRQLLLKRYDTEYEEQSQMSSDVELDLSSCSEEDRSAAAALLETVRSVLASSLRTKYLNLDCNFYQLGGNSLNSVFTVTKLRDQGYNIGISEFISASTLREVLQRMRSDGEVIEESKPEFTAHLLTHESKQQVYTMIIESFYEKADLERWLQPALERKDYRELLDAIWPALVEKNLSFTVRSSDGKDIAVALNFDAYDEPDVQIKSQLSIVFEFLEFLEGPVRETQLPRGQGKILHSFMMGTQPSLSAAENVDVIGYMEEEVLRLARDRGFQGVFTTNTSPLTQQLGNDIYGYKVLQDYQVNQYVTPNGDSPFASAPDWQRAVCCWHTI